MGSSETKIVRRNIAFYVIIIVMSIGSISQPNNISTQVLSSPLLTDNHSDIAMSSKPSDYNDYSINSYSPVTNISDAGIDFITHDHINVEHDFSLNFTYDSGDDSFVADYTISPISGYTEDFLNYGITEIRAKKDNYNIEDLFDDEQILDIESGTVLIAQGFEIIWSNATFYGAYLNLDIIGGGPHTNNDEIEIFLVRANESSGLPDLSERVSNELSGPYSRLNVLPAYGSTVFYDFEDVNLSQGSYFIIVNSTVSEPSGKDFAWRGHLESSNSGGDTYYYSNSSVWSLEEIDHTLSVQLLPSDGNGTAVIFENFSEITLEDNALVINTFADTIFSTGLHHLTSDTSIEVDFINSYTFYQEALASSTYSASNSTFDSYSIDWNFTWSVGSVDYSPYSNLNRSLLLYVPNDWYHSPTAQNNSSPISIFTQTFEGYEFFLGDNKDASNITLQTSSPNYIQALNLSDDEGLSESFILGYWTNDGNDADGYVGDTVYAEITIKNSEDIGSANFTLFDPQGKILPIKSVSGNLSYLDTTPYTQGSITSSGSGIYNSQITLDPSIYGSDSVGYWTAYVFWDNGSEIGLFTKRISIQASIIFNASWETLPSTDVWTSDDSLTILRKNGDSLNVKASYFSNSEPFFSEFGTPIENASIGYLTNWGLEDYLDEYPTEFSGAIPIYTTAGLRTIILTLNDSWSIQEMIDIQVEVFNEYSINPVDLNVEANDTQEVILAFSMVNETDPAKGLLIPDDVDVKINTNEVSDHLYTIANQGDIVYVTVNLAGYGITSGNVNISLEITKQNFKSSYTEDIVTITYSVEITADSEPSLPMYAIIAIAASIFVVITAIAVTATILSRRKTSEQIMDIHDKSKVVGLLESVLALKKTLILHTETSLPVFEMDIGESSGVESTLVSGFLAALTQMGRTISGTEAGEIRKLQYRNFVVSSAHSETYTIYLFSTDDIIKEIQSKLFDIIMWFEYSFQIKDAVWDGRIERFQEKRSLIQDKLADSLYVWLYFPLKFNQSKSREIKKLDKSDLKIALFMKKKGDARVSDLISKYQESSIEETLTSIFSLLNKGFLERAQFSSYKQS